MANKTSIEWTDYNWNFLRGCSRVSEGCRNCYAEGVAARFSGEGMPYEGLAKFVDHKPRWTGEISFHEDILLLPLRWTKPRKVFVNSMSDLFHEKVTDEMLDKAFAVMALTPQHTYQILTKRPERMRQYFGKTDARKITGKAWTILGSFPKFKHQDILHRSWPLPNVWLGVSVEDQKTFDERVPLLLDCPAAIRWLSIEPLLDFIDLQFIACNGQPTDIDWVVVGGESGPNARACDITWISEIVNQCYTAGVPVFVKQLGAVPVKPFYYGDCGKARLMLKSKKGNDMDEFPVGLRIREFPRLREMPTATA